MENAEEVMQFLEDFSKRKPKTIPQELNDYLAYVARTGDPVYQWSLVKSLFKEKLLNVITDFYETTPSIEIPPYPNVDPFNYDLMKNSLLERLDTFTSAPFTVQRICELLTYPRKQYNRVDKFMRAVEKNILVVSTREPGAQRHVEPENGEPMEPIVNGSDNNSEYNVDVEMEDMSWKENNQQKKPSEPQPSSSDTQITVDDIEARLQAKVTTPMETQDKTNTEYESVTPPEINVTSDEETPKPSEDTVAGTATTVAEVTKSETKIESKIETSSETKTDIEMKSEESLKDPLEIPEIKVDDADMTEQRLLAEANAASETPTETSVSDKTEPTEPVEEKPVVEVPQTAIDESSSDSNIKEENEIKSAPEVSTSSEESCSSSDNTDGNSNSPKTDSEPTTDVQEESSQSDSNPETVKQPEEVKEEEDKEINTKPVKETPQIQPDNYSITDVHSELPQPPAEPIKAEESPKEPEVKKVENSDEKKDDIVKTEELETVLETKDA